MLDARTKSRSRLVAFLKGLAAFFEGAAGFLETLVAEPQRQRPAWAGR